MIPVLGALIPTYDRKTVEQLENDYRQGIVHICADGHIIGWNVEV